MKWPWVPRWVYEQAELRARVAEDRLYAAHKEGALIPPRAPFEPREPEVIKLLPDKLASYIENWESPETRADLDREARRLHYDLGYPEERVLQLWTDRANGPAPSADSE